MRRVHLIAAGGLLLLVLAHPSLAQEQKKGHVAEMNKQFTSPNLDVPAWVKRFESEARDIAAHKDEIVAAAGLKPGMAVADIGAGTGLFCWPFAEKVGKEGKVYAVDISEAFLKYIDEQAKKRNLDGIVKTVRAEPDSANLPPGSIDVAFLCATYHHFDHPERNLKSIHDAIRPGGRVVLVDFDIRPNSPPSMRQHARAPREVYFREFAAAGFALAASQPNIKLTDNFIAVFDRKDQ